MLTPILEMLYNAILTHYVIERFLYRLSKSPLSQRYALKGAMLFRVWSGRLHRPTKDLDLLGRGKPGVEAAAQAVGQVLATPVFDDGLTFDAASVTAVEIREEKRYGGVRVKLVARLGSARIPMQIDIGFGDAVTPEPAFGVYPVLLKMDAPRLRMIPPETVVAEKLETAVTLGLVNSRMKDYYDLLAIIRTRRMDSSALAQALAATFRRRETPLPTDVPPGLSDDFGADATARRRWQEFLRRTGLDDAPPELLDAVRAIRTHLWPVMIEARSIRND